MDPCCGLQGGFDGVKGVAIHAEGVVFMSEEAASRDTSGSFSFRVRGCAARHAIVFAHEQAFGLRVC